MAAISTNFTLRNGQDFFFALIITCKNPIELKEKTVKNNTLYYVHIHNI
jgi:hypothetical protein